eukprot:CAMPEP_0172297724 /NCGR_PEP_ID=MMETSP1058-20130122/638_1 /TAXON_ID=83371 /ORGANISM="Detonula confervacea, Strain CCMP 353" /LENGTH=1541 /DNA_ID=CAMNT_0013006907 /DNA_START=91 /DNA_END=4716 /DNA_ORIENTATION=-
MSFADQSFDSFDADESLLVSPTANRTQARDGINNNGSGRQSFSLTCTNQQLEECHDDNDNTNASRESSSSSTAAADESFMAQTPVKSKFNYASAMEELECLAPTPATAKREHRSTERPLFEAEEEMVESGSSAQRQSVMASLLASSSPPPSPTVEASFENAASSALSDPKAERPASAPSMRAATARDSALLLASPHYEAGRPATAPTETSPAANDPSNQMDSNIAVAATSTSSGSAAKDAASVFRHPCIRTANSAHEEESPSLKLRLGCPVNESYDCHDYHSRHSNAAAGFASGGDDDERMANDADLSMEVEKDSAENEEFLVEDSKIDNLDMAAVGVTVATESVKQLDEEEKSNENDSHNNGSLGENADESHEHTEGGDSYDANDFANDDGDERMINDADLSMEVEKDSAGNEQFLVDDGRTDNVDIAAVGVNLASESINQLDEAEELNGNHHDGSLGENADESYERAEEGAAYDVDVSIDLAMTTGKVNHRRRPKFRPALDDQSNSDISDSFEAAVNGETNAPDNNSAALGIGHDAAAPWDLMDSDDDSEEDTKTNQQSDYVDKMNDSIASYFSNRSSSPTVDGDGDNHASLESSSSLLNGSSSSDTVARPLAHEADISHETQEPSFYSKQADDEEEGMINLAALGDDASQIDVEETLEYVGQVQNIQYQRYENVLGELNGKLNDIGTVDYLEGEAQNNSESIEESQDFDHFKEDENDDTSESIDESSFLPNADQYERQNDNESGPIAGTSYSSENNDTRSTVKCQQLSGDQAEYELEEKIEFEPIAETSGAQAAAVEGEQPVEDQVSSNDIIIGTSFEGDTSHFAPEDTIPAKLPDKLDTEIKSDPIAEAIHSSENNIARKAAEGFCDSVIKSSIVGITSNAIAEDGNSPTKLPNVDGSQFALALETEAYPPQPSSGSQEETKTSLEKESMINAFPHDSLFPDGEVTQPTSSAGHALQVSSPPSETGKIGPENLTTRRKSRPSQLKTSFNIVKEAPLLGTLSDALSPISKSSSPHNSCDLSHSTQHTNDNKLVNVANEDRHVRVNHLPTILDASPISESLSPPCQQFQSGGLIIEQTYDNATDEMANVHVDQDDICNQEPANDDVSSERSDEMNSSAGSDITAKRASIFQVLSQPIQERSDTNLDRSVEESELEKFHTQDRSPKGDVERPMAVVYKESGFAQVYLPIMDVEHKKHVENENSPASSTMEKVNSPADASPCEGDVDNTPEAEDKMKSIEDLSSYQQNINSTSSAFLERLRGAAENRKREVTRGRYSMERKEQILYEEKKVRAEMPMSAVSEETMMEEPPTTFGQKKTEGDGPYKPFKARPLPTSTTEYVRPVFRAPKNTVAVSQRKSLAPGENPYIAFKARPMPGPSGSRSSASIGAKRKSSTVFRPHPAQNKSYVKSSALNAKPPSRILSGEDASIAKEMSRKKRMQEDEARIRRESSFKARPLPVTTLKRNQGPLAGEDLVPAKPARSGKENSYGFVPRSSIRAIERASYDAEKAEREEKHRHDQLERRNNLIDQTKAEIKDLTKYIR